MGKQLTLNEFYTHIKNFVDMYIISENSFIIDTNFKKKCVLKTGFSEIKKLFRQECADGNISGDYYISLGSIYMLEESDFMFMNIKYADLLNS